MRPQQWVNAGPDEGATHALLGRIAQQIPVTTIDEVWVFPTRRVTEGESTVIVAAAFEAHDERRRVFTWRFVVSRNKRGAATVREHAHEFGSAPSNAIARIIEGVLRRLGDDAEVPPHGRAIAGDQARWVEWIEELGGEVRGTAGTAGGGEGGGEGEGNAGETAGGEGEGSTGEIAGEAGEASAGETAGGETAGVTADGERPSGGTADREGAAEAIGRGVVG